MQKKTNHSEDEYVDVFGNLHEQHGVVEANDHSIYVLMSALQKYVRRGMTEKAMFFAIKLAEVSWYKAWQRLRVIAVEDVGQPDEIAATEVLYHWFLDLRQGKQLTWDAKRLVACSAKVLAEAKKDRRNDEILEILEQAGKDNEKAKQLATELAAIDDFVYDQHTAEGKRMGRGLEYWIKESSKVANGTESYLAWRKKFEEVMLSEMQGA